MLFIQTSRYLPQVVFMSHYRHSSLFIPILQPLRLSSRTVRAMDTPESSSEPSTSDVEAPEDSDDLLIELQMAKRRPKAKTPQPAPGSYKVISATRDQVYGDAPMTPIQQFENSVISFLALLFFIILGEGIFLAASGFMSEAADQFAQDVVYPAFSPSLGLFLLSSSLYGLWKTGAGREDTDKKQ